MAGVTGVVHGGEGGHHAGSAPAKDAGLQDGKGKKSQFIFLNLFNRGFVFSDQGCESVGS